MATGVHFALYFALVFPLYRFLQAVGSEYFINKQIALNVLKPEQFKSYKFNWLSPLWKYVRKEKSKKIFESWFDVSNLHNLNLLSFILLSTITESRS